MTAPISVQLYSLREEAKRGLAPILERLGRIGYVGVESAGLHDLTPAAFKRCLADAGLVVSSGHIALPKPKAPREVLDQQEAIGNKDLVVAILPPDKFADADGVRTCAERLNAFNEKARARGMSLGYHNHWWEFSNRIGNETAHAMLFRLLDPTVFAEVDTYWAKVGGADPARRGARSRRARPLVAHQGWSGRRTMKRRWWRWATAHGRGRDRESEPREVARRGTRSAVRPDMFAAIEKSHALPDQPRSCGRPGVTCGKRRRRRASASSVAV